MESAYEIGRFVHIPGHSIYVFYVRFSPGALFRPGALGDVLEVFYSRRIPIVHIKVSRPSREEPVKTLLFADLTKGKYDAWTITREIRKLEQVEHVEYSEPVFDGFSVYSGFLPLTMLGERAIILRRSLYEAFIKLLEEKLGTGYAAMLYHIGFEMGKQAFNSHKLIAGDDAYKLAKVREAFFSQVGFGRLEIVHLDDRGLAIARVYDCFECELFKGLQASQQPCKRDYGRLVQ